MICCPRSTASVHFREGCECVTDRTCCGSGCRIGAVTLLYAQSPRIAASGRPMTPTISASQVAVRFFATLLSGDFVTRTPFPRSLARRFAARSVRVARSLPLARATAAACFSIPKLHYPRDFVPRPPYTLSRAPLRGALRSRGSLAAARSRDRGGVFPVSRGNFITQGTSSPGPLTRSRARRFHAALRSRGSLPLARATAAACCI